MLGSLSHAHKEILLMRFVDDMTQPEIAAALELPLRTVKSPLQHAVRAVKNSPAIATFCLMDDCRPSSESCRLATSADQFLRKLGFAGKQS
ncbi:MAG: sigma factor-like helix-turn-helix DNA-binding protein [Fuerstiella sp.]